MGIDTSKIRVGDEVVLRTTITDTSINYLGADNWLAVSCRDIVEHHPKPREIKAGDEVTCIYGDKTFQDKVWRVLHVHEGKVWIDGLGLLLVSDLRHAD